MTQIRSFDFTDRAMRGLPVPPKPNQLDYFDTNTRGLGLRVSYGGQRSFFLMYSSAVGKRQRKSLGPFGKLEDGRLSLAAARRKAKATLGDVASGGDPAGEARAQKLAGKFDGFAVALSEIEGTLPEADILISSTASPEPILNAEQMAKAVRARRRRPVFAVDIAVPRDLDPAIGELDDVYLYTIDDLDKVILEGQSNREAAADDADRILQDETRRYLSIERGKEVAPVITALREHGDDLRADVMEQARRRLAKGADAEDVLAYVTASLLKKLLHNPSVRLRAAGEQSDQQLIDAARSLFGLDDEED